MQFEVCNPKFCITLSLKRILKWSFLISHQHLVTFAVVCTERSCFLLCGRCDLKAAPVLHLYFYVALGHIAVSTIFWWIIQYTESFLYLILLSLPGCCLGKYLVDQRLLKRNHFQCFCEAKLLLAVALHLLYKHKYCWPFNLGMKGNKCAVP